MTKFLSLAMLYHCGQMLENVTKEEEKILLQKLVRGMMNDPRPNAWEREFLVSIYDQLLARDLSEKQMNVLNTIKQKYKTPVK